MRTARFIFLSLIIFFSLTSCQRKKQTTDTELSKYLTAYTQGMINADDIIEFRFVNGLDISGDKIKGKIKTTPAFDFDIKTNDEKTNLQIIPSSPLRRGGIYEITIPLDNLYDDKISATVISKLSVFEQHLEVAREGLILNDNRTYLDLAVTTALDEDIQNMYSIFKYDESKIQVTEITPRDFDVRILFDPREGKKSILWNGEIINSKESGVLDVWDYDEDEFTVINSYFNKEEKQYKIYFTKPLDGKQDAKGLIQIGKKNAQYTFEYNTIVVYVDTNTEENISLSISKGIKASDGSKLDSELNYDIENIVVRPELSWLDNGIYIPSDGEFKVPFKAKGLKSVEVSVVAIRSEEMSKYASWNSMTYMDRMEMIRFGELAYQTRKDLSTNNSINLSNWNEFGLDFSDAFQREKGVLYHVILFFGPSNTIVNCENQLIYDFEKEVVSDRTFDTKSYGRNYYGYYDYKEVNNPCHISYYINKQALTKNIHCTNVFPIIKKAGKDVHVAIKDLQYPKVGTGAEVSILSLQGKTIDQQSTGKGGIVSFKNLTRDIHAVKIKYQGETSFFNLEAGNENSLTEFDISSNVRDVDNKLFVYTERDVWRPGDTVHLNIMLHRERFDYPDDLPIVVKFKNPKGVVYKTYLQSIQSDQHIYNFDMPTTLEALTGYWSVDISIGPLKKTKSLRIETIKPNVVDLVYKFKGEDKNWVYSEKLDGVLDVQYLSGYPMSKGKVTAEANISSIFHPFDKYKNYVFKPLITKAIAKGEKLWKTTTNKDGVANIKKLTSFKTYGGVTKIIIDTKIDLPSGGLNTETETRIVSPYNSYVGINAKTGRGWRGAFAYGEKPIFDIITVDKRGHLNKVDKAVEITILKYKKDWWYDRHRLGRDHNYRNKDILVTVQNKKITLQDGMGQYVHEGKDYDSGTYILKVKDLDSGHIAEYSFHHITSQNYAANTTPEFFTIEMEKSNFNIGENAEIKLPQIEQAKALVSIERGDKVLDIFWMDLNQSNLTLPIKKEWFPNFYIHTTIVQDYGQQDNDRPMRMYTVKKVNVNEPDKTLALNINAPEKAEPDKSFTIEISEQNGQSCEYTLAVVDMGLLNLTGYQTPDPLAHFSKNLSLRVKTWDIFQKLIYYMNPSFAGILSIGGDGSLDRKQDESADFNRFEPVVFHVGPTTLNANGTNTHKITLPKYIGKLKVMAIATNGNTFGSEEKNIRVVSPLMVQSQLPRSLNITDVVQVPVSLFKDEKSINNASISASTSNSLLRFDQQNITTSFNDEDQKIETINFTTGNESGTTEINFNATSGQFQSVEETKIFINYPNSYSGKTDYYEIKAGESKELDINSFGFEKTKNVTLNISGALVPNLITHYQDLIEYPYGCLEQTTSRAFALMYINTLVNLTPEEEHIREEFLDASILRIQSFQRANGQFNYWRNGYYHNWSDLYAGHFLIDARDQNRLSKNEALALWLDYQKGIANKWKMAELSDEYIMKREELLQAYRLFLLAKAGKPSKSAMNRFRKSNAASRMAQFFLAGAYAFAGMEDTGITLFNNALNSGESDRLDSYSFGSSIRNKAIVIYIMSLFSDGTNLDRYYSDWVQEINNARWTSTQDKGFAFMACNAYFGESQNIDSHIEYELTSSLVNKIEKIHSQTNKQYNWNWDELSDTVNISNNGESTLFVSKTQRAISTELYSTASSSKIVMDVRYADEANNSLKLKDLKQGQEIVLKVKIRNTDILDQENLALTVKAASGWEIINPRLYTTNEDKQNNFNYQDFRDDKVYTYFQLKKNEEVLYAFRFKANLKGDYYLPSVFCENMYDGDVYARNQASRTIIK